MLSSDFAEFQIGRPHTEKRTITIKGHEVSVVVVRSNKQQVGGLRKMFQEYLQKEGEAVTRWKFHIPHSYS